MAKPASIKIRLNSTADTGFFYVTKKNARTMTEKLVLKKYDPVAQEARRVPRRQDQVATATDARRAGVFERGARTAVYNPEAIPPKTRQEARTRCW